MFFVISKLLGFFLNPITFFLTFAVLCLFVYWLGFHKLARYSAIAIAILFLLNAYTQFPDYLLQKLEVSHDGSVLDSEQDKIIGIIVLGGAVAVNRHKKRDWYHTNPAAERIIEGIHLAKKFPHLPIIYTGGNGNLINDGSVEADGFVRIVDRLGGLKNEVILEKRSKNTRQNARFSAEIIRGNPNLAPDGHWLLVTSAFHMKRSVASFKKEGINVIQWPTDFRADVLRFPWIVTSPGAQLKKLKTFIHEVIGLVAYEIVGSQPTGP